VSRPHDIVHKHCSFQCDKFRKRQFCTAVYTPVSAGLKISHRISRVCGYIFTSKVDRNLFAFYKRIAFDNVCSIGLATWNRSI